MQEENTGLGVGGLWPDARQVFVGTGLARWRSCCILLALLTLEAI